jgi:hypothetical protein
MEQAKLGGLQDQLDQLEKTLEALSTLCWQIHRGLTVSVPLSRAWVHCPRASSGLLPRRSDLVVYVQRDARFDQVLLVKQSFPTALQVAIPRADYAVGL